MANGLERVLAAALLALMAAGCRDASGDTAVFDQNPIPVSPVSAVGCVGANLVFPPPPLVPFVPVTDLAGFNPGPMSQITALRSAEILFATGADGSVYSFDFTGGDPPAVAEHVAPGFLTTNLLSGLGLAGPAELSGIAVLSPSALVVAEHASNTLLLVNTAAMNDVQVLAGFPSAAPGFADGVGALARFAFTGPVQLAPAGDGRLFLTDPGNHAVRQLQNGIVSTISGAGTPFFQDGDLAQAGFDTPVGITVTCSDQLLVAESGLQGLGGHRIRAVSIGTSSFFGSAGSVATLAGTGVADSVEGIGAAALLDAPVSPVTTAGGDIYWIDSGTGVMRRIAAGSMLVDCPLSTSCAQAQVDTPFTPGGAFSLTMTAQDHLYVLDVAAATLFRITL